MAQRQMHVPTVQLIQLGAAPGDHHVDKAPHVVEVQHIFNAVAATERWDHSARVQVITVSSSLP